MDAREDEWAWERFTEGVIASLVGLAAGWLAFRLFAFDTAVWVTGPLAVLFAAHWLYRRERPARAAALTHTAANLWLLALAGEGAVATEWLPGVLITLPLSLLVANARRLWDRWAWEYGPPLPAPTTAHVDPCVVRGEAPAVFVAGPRLSSGAQAVLGFVGCAGVMLFGPWLCFLLFYIVPAVLLSLFRN